MPTRATITLEELAERHRDMVPRLRKLPRECTLLWYADLGVELESDEVVRYYCTGCGMLSSMYLEEFLCQESNTDLHCDQCRGDPEERGGPGN